MRVRYHAKDNLTISIGGCRKQCRRAIRGPLWGMDSAERLRWQVMEGAATAVDDAM